MVKRESVEKILALIESRPDDWARLVPQRLLAELCRTWLAVDGAQTWWVDYKSLTTCTLSVDYSGGQRVKLVLVPEADSGGDRG